MEGNFRQRYRWARANYGRIASFLYALEWWQIVLLGAAIGIFGAQVQIWLTK